MQPDAAGLRAALPETLRARWDHIGEIDARLGASLAGDDLEVVEELARDRRQALHGFAAAFPVEPRSMELRIAALRHLIGVNEQLMSLTQQAFATLTDTSATARHQRRAISAYHENQPK